MAYVTIEEDARILGRRASRDEYAAAEMLIGLAEGLRNPGDVAEAISEGDPDESVLEMLRDLVAELGNSRT